MKLRAYGASDIGLVRKRNEDSWLLDLERKVFVVADGLGGLPGGNLASAAAIAAVQTDLAEASGVPNPGNLRTMVEHAHFAVQAAGQPFAPAQIGTTLTLASIRSGGGLLIAHVGDSFAFLVRGTSCRALTREHNVENERAGPLELAPFPPAHRFALTRIVGGAEPVNPDIFEEKLQSGDRLVLATDGLTDLLDSPQIAEVCAAHPDPGDAAPAFIDAALRAGGHDNITVIVVAVDSV